MICRGTWAAARSKRSSMGLGSDCGNRSMTIRTNWKFAARDQASACGLIPTSRAQKPNTRRTAQDPRRIICVHQRASPSFICGKILPSRCCQPTRTKVLASLHAPDVPSVPTLEPSSDQPVKTPAQRHQRGIAMPEIVRVSDTPRCRSGSKRCCSVSCRAATCCGGCRHSKVRRRRRKCTGTRNSKAPRRHHHLATGRNFLAHATSSSRSPSRRT